MRMPFTSWTRPFPSTRRCFYSNNPYSRIAPGNFSWRKLLLAPSGRPCDPQEIRRSCPRVRGKTKTSRLHSRHSPTFTDISRIARIITILSPGGRAATRHRSYYVIVTNSANSLRFDWIGFPRCATDRFPARSVGSARRPGRSRHSRPSVTCTIYLRTRS